ncbi:hypothetical protein DFJ74DRAFT_704340 [Hyaloraphidium curvatum]|nr:hypothetical protein DFJ74DRAFT_704340 [Hyaloraphidium curvatum]
MAANGAVAAPGVLSAARNAVVSTAAFYRLLAFYLAGGAYGSASRAAGLLLPARIASDKRARVQIFSLALIFRLWSKPHYRNPSFQVDLLRNLRNVAVPGTGVPLSLFCHTKATALLYVLFALPTVCFFGAWNTAVAERRRRKSSLLSPGLVAEALATYVEYLLHPPDWFSFWQLNCRLATFHSYKTRSPGYALEDKWTFLKRGDELGVPVSPFLKMPSLVIKDTNEEGGMGIYFYRNAVHGGNWIIQERLENSDELKALLPPNPPLSTVRVITTSTWSRDHPWDLPSEFHAEDAHKYIKAVSCVFRAGRKGASTDHSSVLFDVDKATGTILRGTTNAHWYHLGPKGLTTPWRSTHDLTDHPDVPGLRLTGKSLPDVPGMLDLVVRSHFKMLPDVTIVGWDVAYTTRGIFFLEVNLSCNFFRGTFDVPAYFDWVDSQFAALDKLGDPPANRVKSL